MRVLFLDIDGVIQFWEQNRFEHSTEEIWQLCRDMTKKFNGVFDFEKWARNDGSNQFWTLAAVYWDWRPSCVAQLKRVLDTANAKIVLSSSWRDEGFEAMQALFRIYDLDKYYVGNTLNEWLSRGKNFNAVEKCLTKVSGYSYVDSRSVEIREYLDRFPEITGYAAVDDMNLEKLLEGHFVGSWHGGLTKEKADQLIEILKSDGGPFPLPEKVRKMPALKRLREYIDIVGDASLYTFDWLEFHKSHPDY